MTTNKEHIVDTEQLVEDYQSFLDYINQYYKVKITLPVARILKEIITLHLKGTLDDRIFSMFRNFTDDWDTKLLELLTDGKLDGEDIGKLERSVRYRDLKMSAASLIRSVYFGHDPNFTIWEVELGSDNSFAIISACGDYRIEQWHHEHHVTKLEIKDVVSYDMRHLVGFIHKAFGYSKAPGRISYSPNVRSKIRNSKKNFFEELIKNYVGFKLSDNKADEKRFSFYVDVLCKEQIINAVDVAAKIQALDSFFELEVRHQLDKMSNFKQVTSFTISGEEIIINFGSYKSHERNSLSYAELELKAAEANGDYIPERHRKLRG